MMSFSVAIVGAGPTAIYSIQALLSLTRPPATISVFERQRRAGQGTPYSAHWSDPIMLANIASIEIPALPERLVDWLRAQPEARLAVLGVRPEDIDERAFFPRLALGEYLSAQFDRLVSQARSLGVKVHVHTQARVSDVALREAAIEVTVAVSRKGQMVQTFDYAILATGHEWPSEPEIRPGYFTSPWPAGALLRIRNCAVGIRGTALSAIDAAVVVADQHGEFLHIDDDVVYRAKPATELFSITMLSRKGILPEADFYHPLPYEPLAVCTTDAIERLITTVHDDDLLEATFLLFREELTLADPGYARDLGLAGQTLEEFCSAYFAPRESTDPFVWARRNLEEAVRNLKTEKTVQWRYAILRMHEVIGLIAPHLSDAAYVRFNDTLKAVFVDNYATVPHESIRRLLALHAAQKLQVERLEGGRRLDTRSAVQGAILIDGAARTHFPAFIEATGQQVSGADDFPFRSLLRQGVIEDAHTDDDSDLQRGIAIDGNYRPISALKSSRRLFCLSLPFLLGQHPFAQGMTSSADMAGVVAAAIEAAESTERSAVNV